MKIEHIAIWADDLEAMKSYYETYFDAQAGDLYRNEAKRFTSYFLTFASGCRLELMRRDDLRRNAAALLTGHNGYAHMAFSLGSRDAVDAITQRLVDDGFEKHSGPRVTGDGCYEAALYDPEGNLVEITE